MYQTRTVEDERLILQLIKVNKNLKKLRKQLRSRSDIYERDFNPDYILDSNPDENPEYNPDDWYTLQTVLDELPVSKSTVYRYRDEKLIRWEKKGGIPRYYRPDVERLKYKCMK